MRRVIFLALALGAGCGDDDGSAGPVQAGGGAKPDPSAAIYDEDALATVELTMDPADWQAIVDTPDDNTFRRAVLQWEGETVPDVGVRPSGVTTRVPGNPKPAMRLDFDAFIPGREWRGVEQIRLDGFYRDGSMLRDRVSYWVYRELGMVAPRCVHARLIVNGSYRGVYGVEEPVRKELVKRGWGENDGNLYELIHSGSTPPDPYSWQGADPASYVPFPFEPKGATPGDPQDVAQFLDVLNNTPLDRRGAELAARVLNVAQFIAYLGVLQALADFDGPTASWGPNNHYWYRPVGTGRFEIIPWDPEFALGLFGHSPETTMWRGFDRTVLTAWISADPVARVAFKDAVRRVLDGPFTRLAERIDFIYAQIRDEVYLDPYKRTSNQNFDAAWQSMKTWVTRREASLRTQLAQ